MSNDTPFNAMMPPNTTLTSRTASSGYASCASCACVIWSGPDRRLGPRDPRDPADLAARHDDEGYLIPSTTRATFPPALNFLLSAFFDCVVVAPREDSVFLIIATRHS